MYAVTTCVVNWARCGRSIKLTRKRKYCCTYRWNPLHANFLIPFISVCIVVDNELLVENIFVKYSLGGLIGNAGSRLGQALTGNTVQSALNGNTQQTMRFVLWLQLLQLLLKKKSNFN
jgi:hypothetical protein